MGPSNLVFALYRNRIKFYDGSGDSILTIVYTKI